MLSENSKLENEKISKAIHESINELNIARKNGTAPTDKEIMEWEMREAEKVIEYVNYPNQIEYNLVEACE